MKRIMMTVVGTMAVMTSVARESVCLDYGWEFRWGKDGAWQTVDLPHDAQFAQPWTQKDTNGARGFKPMGEGTYKKKLEVRSKKLEVDGVALDLEGKRLLLDVGGLLCVGDVYVNGTKVASTDYGYLGFDADITKALKEGDNEIKVWFSTGKMGGSRWYTGAGLFRGVRLVTKNAIAIARHGLYTTGETNGVVKVSVELDGFRGKGRDTALWVEATIKDADGKVVGNSRTRAPWSKLQHQEVALDMTIASPHLWNLDDPYLYTCEAKLVLDEKTLDETTARFGLRKIEEDYAYGFKLNGRKVFLKGMSNHHDLGLVGAAAYRRAIKRQLQLMKDFGYNAIRCSHNPYSEDLYDLCDEMGILVVDELIDKWSDKDYWFGRKPFTTLWPYMMTEWMKRDRNHASVIAWSFGNEFQMREDFCGYPMLGDWGVTMYKVMREFSKRWDATRPTTAAMFPARKGALGKKDKGFWDDPEPPEVSVVADFASFNYQYPAYASYVKHVPGLNIFQSEATVNDHAVPYLAMDKEHSIGCSYWGAIEYWGESNRWPKKGWNYSFFSHTLEPYPMAYLIRSVMTDEPVVRLAVETGKGETHEWNDVQVGRISEASVWEGKEGEIKKIVVYTNAREAELKLNGKAIAKKLNNAKDRKEWNKVRFEVPFKPGEITAIGITDGKGVAGHTVKTAGQAASLDVVFENEDDFAADGHDLLYVRCRVVDANGTPVVSATNRVTFTCEGAAKFLACDNGDHYVDELFTPEVNAKNAKDGFILAAFRSGVTPGKAKITIAAEGLPVVEKSVEVK